ncbi:MAG: guanylate kinase [Armatimonadota bacterium]|nr:guanylate kinase [bacterium]
MQTWDKYVRKSGLLFVLSGPSGVGKDAVLEELSRIYPGFRRCVTATTRQPRFGEVDGVDYTFMSVDEFRERAELGEFLEYAHVHGNLYGTPKQWVQDQLWKGKDVILKIDVQGGLSVKEQMPSAILVFLVPPSLEELEKRLRGRLTENDEEVSKRLLDARRELDQIPHYEYIVENDTLLQTAEELKAVIIAEHCRIQRQ